MMPLNTKFENATNAGGGGGGTPSKDKTRSSFFSRTTYNGSINSSSSRSSTSIVRWILFGFGVGAACTAFLTSINIPTIRVEVEYGDAPPDMSHSVNNKKHVGRSTRLVIGPGDQDAEVEQDDDSPLEPKEDAPEIEHEREALAEELEKEGKEEEAKELLDDIALEATPKGKPKGKKYGELVLVPGEMVHEADDPDFSNPGPVPSLDVDNGEAFAACILIKDDNHWLIEWLAYHYHTMPLRYLIVAVDPDSKTSPRPILKRWSDRKLMNIFLWDDAKFMPAKIKTSAKTFDNNTELMMHRVRQNNFYFKCMRTFKARQREWLMLIDTDEYIVNNYASGLYYNITKHIPITEPGNVLKFIKQHHGLTGENHTCSYMPRYMFGVKESSKTMVDRNLNGTGMSGNDFVTQRFLYRNARRMHNGKNLINLQKLPAIKTYTSVHHVSSYCPDPDKMRAINHVKKALVKVHHYLGTEEQYFFRSDPRQANVNATKAPAGPKPKTIKSAYFTRDKQRFNTLNSRANYPDQGARVWIKGFIADVGLETAKELLKDIGKVGTYYRENTSEPIQGLSVHSMLGRKDSMAKGAIKTSMNKVMSIAAKQADESKDATAVDGKGESQADQDLVDEEVPDDIQESEQDEADEDLEENPGEDAVAAQEVLDDANEAADAPDVADGDDPHENEVAQVDPNEMGGDGDGDGNDEDEQVRPYVEHAEPIDEENQSEVEGEVQNENVAED